MFLKVLGYHATKSVGNPIALFKPAAACWGDSQDKVVALTYMVVFDVTSVTSINQIRIGGVTYTFTAECDPATAAGKAAIIAEIKAIMKTLERSEGNLYFTQSGDLAALYTDYSDIAFEWIEASANEFVPFEGMVIGVNDSTESGFSLLVEKLADGTYDVTVRIHAGTSISAFSVTYNAVSKTTAVPANNKYKFNAAAVLAEAATALIISITPTGGSANSKTITEILSNYRR